MFSASSLNKLSAVSQHAVLLNFKTLTKNRIHFGWHLFTARNALKRKTEFECARHSTKEKKRRIEINLEIFFREQKKLLNWDEVKKKLWLWFALFLSKKVEIVSGYLCRPRPTSDYRLLNILLIVIHGAGRHNVGWQLGAFNDFECDKVSRFLVALQPFWADSCVKYFTAQQLVVAKLSLFGYFRIHNSLSRTINVLNSTEKVPLYIFSELAQCQMENFNDKSQIL